jgi:hypothetical protein
MIITITLYIAAILDSISPHPAFAVTSNSSSIQQEVLANVQDMLQTTPSDTLVLLRFDQLADTLVRIAQREITNNQEQVNYVINGLSVSSIWCDVLYDPFQQQCDLSLFVAAMLGLLPGEYGIDPYPGFLESREKALETWYSFADRIEIALQDVKQQLSPQTIDLAPVYQITYGYINATNAKMTGVIPDTSNGAGRCIIILNIGARWMLDPDVFQIAATHETWHCYSGATIDNSANDLLKVTMTEGVVTYLTSRSNSTVEDDHRRFATNDLLFWSTKGQASAEQLQQDILNEFTTVRSNLDFLEDWIYANKPLSVVPGAPSRCAYYVGLLAFQAYVDQQEHPPSAQDLLEPSNSPEGRETVWK